jgi:hypothetical protein
VGQAAAGTSEVSVQVERVNAGVGETTGSLDALREGADNVARQGDTLRDEVSGLAARLRSDARRAA